MKRTLLYFSVLLLLASQVFSAEKVFHRIRRIEIPYSFKDGDNSSFGTMELFYSMDRGRTWKSAGRDPDARSPFVFHAPSDGTYWFAARAIDKSGTPRPVNLDMYQPKFEHVVDTVAPKLVVSISEQDLDGKKMLVVTWDGEDKNLDPASIRIETKNTPEDANWQNLEVPDIASKVARYEISREDIAKMYVMRVSLFDYSRNAAAAVITKNFTSEPVIKYEYYSEAIKQDKTPRLKEGGGRTVDAAIAQTQKLLVAVHYQTNDVGPSGVKAVDLYYTTDDGVSWHYAGPDPDLTSPVYFSAPAEGQYGFKVVLTNGAGVSNGAPETGESPETISWIDMTRPKVRLYEPEGGEILRGGEKMLVRWAAEDRCPADVRIEYSPDAGLKWYPVRTDLPMRGQLVLKVPMVDSSQYKLRLVCTDKVGHRSEMETGKPLIITTSTPKVRLQVDQKIDLMKIRPRGDDNRTAEPAEQVAMKAAVLRSQGKYAQALAIYRSLRKKYPERASILNDMAGTYMQMGRYRNAVPLYTRAVGLRPKNVIYNYNLGYTLYLLERYGEAKSYFQRAVDLDPSYYAANMYLARISIWQGLYSHARVRLERILALPNLKPEWREEAEGLLNDWGYRSDRPGRDVTSNTMVDPLPPPPNTSEPVSAGENS